MKCLSLWVHLEALRICLVPEFCYSRSLLLFAFCHRIFVGPQYHRVGKLATVSSAFKSLLQKSTFLPCLHCGTGKS